MIKTGDKVVCISGNDFYAEGHVYTVGSFINDKFFEIPTGCNDEYWYATRDSSGISIHFDTMATKVSNAHFNKLNNQIYAQQRISQIKPNFVVLPKTYPKL